ncbi:DUF3857 domain-containing protein [Aquimarina sp. SS2-1]|uniref:DUF3857 domain-containing protein n=1 Tax=Aquimarina besae TaxID=3342247 RepID=UPI00366FCDD6
MKKIIMLVLLAFSVNMKAQEYKFGKVSKEELLEKSYPLDSSANAVILFETQKKHIQNHKGNGFRLITEVHKRIKLYNKNGFDHASQEILLFNRTSNSEKLLYLEGATYSFKKDSIVKTELKEDGIFTTEHSKNIEEITFTMPSLQEGSVIEFKYKIVSPFLFNVGKIYLQESIPIKKQDIEIITPEYFNFKKVTTGYLPINLTESDKWLNQYGDSYKELTDKIISINVPAFKEEPYCGNSKNYISSINYELAYIKYRYGAIDHRATTWDDVIKNIFNSSNFGDQLNKTNYFKNDIDSLIAGVYNPHEKMKVIFKYLQNKMTWNEMRGVFTYKGTKKSYKEGKGNVADINLTLVSMLRYAGLQAHPVVCSSSDSPVALFPTISGFNYVLARVKISDKEIFYLDASDKYGMLNILPDRIIRGMGRVIAENRTSQLVDFRPDKPSVKAYRLQCQLNEKGIAKGKVSVNHRDYIAHDFRVENAAKDNEDKTKRFENEFGISEIEEYTVEGVKELGKEVNEKFNFIVEDQIETIEDEIFFSPLLFLRDKENVFKSDDRKYPIDFGYSFSNKYMVNIKIPEGYEVVECPKSTALKLPNNMGKFIFRSNVTNGVIQVVVDETITAPVIPASYYQAVKEFYNQVIQKENEQVVLKKI